MDALKSGIQTVGWVALVAVVVSMAITMAISGALSSQETVSIAEAFAAWASSQVISRIL